MASRKLTDLRPEMQAKAQHVIDYCGDMGVSLLVYCTLRTLKEQEDLYAQGRTRPGKIVTYAKPGSSAHNYGLAFDAVPMVGGKPQWGNAAPEWQIYGRAVRDAGLEWAGDWKRFREFPHAQWPNWRSLVG